MPRLSTEDKEQVEIFAQRHAAFILAMAEADDKLSAVPEDKKYDLYTKIVQGDHNQIETPNPSELEDFIQSLETQVQECREKNTPATLMEMMKVANAGTMLMNSHLAYNHPRLKTAVITRMTEIHHTAYRRRWEAKGMLLPDGRVKMGNHVSADPIGNFRPKRKDPNFFNPSDASLDITGWQKITFNEFKMSDGKRLFNNIFFVADPPDGQDYTAFELVSLKHAVDGTIYEVRWEGTSHAEEMTPSNLEERSALGLWASPKPQ